MSTQGGQTADRRATTGPRPEPANAAAGWEGTALVLKVTTLVVALALDNLAIGMALPAPLRRWLPGAGRMGAAALLLAVAGAVLGGLLRAWLGGWAQLMGAAVLFALAVDAIREWAAARPRLLPGELDPPGPAWLTSLQILGTSLDEFGVGLAAGGALGIGVVRPWGTACLAETVVALACGYLLQWRSAGRRIPPMGAAVLFVGCSVLLLTVPVHATP